MRNFKKKLLISLSFAQLITFANAGMLTQNVSAQEDDQIDLHSEVNDPLEHFKIESGSNQNLMSISSSTGAHNFVERIDGSNRMRLAENISQKGWETSNTVFIANGHKFTDALSGTPLASYYDAPILLVNGTYADEATLAEITRLKAKEVVVLGGPDSVSDQIISTFKQRGLSVRRIAGANRYDTSRKIAEELISKTGATTAHLVNGQAFADAVSISTIASRYKQPILLTESNQLHKEVSQISNSVKDWRIIGGEKSVTRTTEDQLKKQVSTVTRISGRNRYEVNKNVLKHWGIQGNSIYMGSGNAFADVLTGSVLASKNSAGILLLSDHYNDVSSAKDFALSRKLDHFTIFGGINTLNKSIDETFKQLIVHREHTNGVYTVQKGDTIRSIGISFGGVTPYQIHQWNAHIKDINVIDIGDRLAVNREGVELMMSAADKANLMTYNNPSQFKTVDEFIGWMAPLAKEVSNKDGEEALYPSLMIAQAIHESGIARIIGESQLARPPYHNLFGIKTAKSNPHVLAWTWEHKNGEDINVYAPFAKFSSYTESLDAYGRLLRYGRGTGEDFYYRGTWRSNTKDVWEVLDNKGLRGYATDPKYFTSVRNVIEKYNLTQYDVLEETK